MARTTFTTAQQLSSTVMNTLQASVWTDDYVTYSSFPYTFVIGDAGKQVFFASSVATPSYLNIPTNATVAFPLGTKIYLFQTSDPVHQPNASYSNNSVYVVPVAGVTLRDATGGSITSTLLQLPTDSSFTKFNYPVLLQEYLMYTLIKTATDTWLITRDGVGPDDLNYHLHTQTFS